MTGVIVPFEGTPKPRIPAYRRFFVGMQRLLFFLCFLPGALSAQVPDSSAAISRFQLGVVYGQMDHEMSFTPASDVEPLRGTEFGVALRYFDKKLVGFQAELSLVEAGWREVLDTSFTSLYDRSIRYAELQILTQFSFGNGVIQPLLQAGPYLAIPLSEEENIPTEYDPGEPVLAPVYGFEFPFKLNYGLRIGAGLNVELGPVTLQLDARYLIGFNDLVRTGDTQVATSRRAGIGGHGGLFWAF